MSGVSAQVFNQLEAFAYACISGAGMAAVYDVIRIFRRIIRHGIVLVSLEDLLYWITFAVVEFILLYQVESGTMRAYVFMGTVVGAAIYHILLGRHLVRAASRLIRFLKGIGKHRKFPVESVLKKQKDNSKM